MLCTDNDWNVLINPECAPTGLAVSPCLEVRGINSVVHNVCREERVCFLEPPRNASIDGDDTVRQPKALSNQLIVNPIEWTPRSCQAIRHCFKGWISMKRGNEGLVKKDLCNCQSRIVAVDHVDITKEPDGRLD